MSSSTPPKIITSIAVYHLCYTKLMDIFETLNSIIGTVLISACIVWFAWSILR
jgi:hypothetical protein